MITLSINATTVTGSEKGTITRVSAWLYKKGELKRFINNVQTTKEVVFNLQNISKELNESQDSHSLKSIIKLFDEISCFKKETTNVKQTALKFKLIDKNYSLKSCITYKDVIVPEEVVDLMQNAKTNNECLSIHRFYLKCLSNPNPNHVKDLFNFIKKSKLIITPSGNFVTFRRIKVVQEPVSKVLFAKISNIFNESMFDKTVNKDAKYATEADCIYLSENGKTIREIHNSILSLEGKYTDNHTRTYDYKVGVNYRELVYDTNHMNLCSKGLHSGSFDYIDGNILGEQIVYCIVNPMKVVAVADNATKVRSSELYIAGLIAEKDWEDFKSNLLNSTIDFDFEDDSFENNYEGLTIEYNTIVGKQNHLLSEKDLFNSFNNIDSEEEDYDYDDEDEEEYDEEEDEASENAKLLSEYEAKAQHYRNLLNKKC